MNFMIERPGETGAIPVRMASGAIDLREPRLLGDRQILVLMSHGASSTASDRDDDGENGSAKTSKAAKILIVEDEGIIAMDMARQLQEFGFEVVGIANNGETALSLACEHRPDLITMDILIKGPVDGIEAARKIRQYLDVPVVFLTAYTDERTRRRAQETVPSGYLQKPTRADDLHAVLLKALRQQREAPSQ